MVHARCGSGKEGTTSFEHSGWRIAFSLLTRPSIVYRLAWNNLLGFPYVYGYSLRTLDELVSRHGFMRIDVCPDTLITDRGSTRGSRVEVFAKWCCRCAGRIERLLDGTGAHTAP
jgi:hypothetical protein